MLYGHRLSETQHTSSALQDAVSIINITCCVVYTLPYFGTRVWPAQVHCIAFILSFECYCNWAILKNTMDNLCLCLINILGFVCSAECILSPTNFHMLPHVACRSSIPGVDKLLHCNLATTTTTLEHMCMMASNFDHSGNWLKECIYRWVPLFHHPH